MKRSILIALAIVFGLSTAALAGKATVGTTDKGQYTDVKILGAEQSDTDGNELTIDIRELNQSSATGARSVLILDQDDVDQPMTKLECTEGSDETNSCSHYSTTNAAKAGTFKIDVNGTTRYVNFYTNPD